MTDSERHVEGASTITVPSIPDVIYEVLRRDISHGVHPPGRLSIRQLAAEFGVSAMPVREALRRLQAEGLVSFKGGRQVVIEELVLDDLIELFAIRSELEILAMRRAVPVLSGDRTRLAVLGSLIDEMDGLAGDYPQWREVNGNFHRSIYEAAGMPRLSAMIDSVGVSVEPYARLYGGSPAGLRLAQDQHRAIVGHIHANDPAEASAVLSAHLENQLEVLRSAASNGSLSTERKGGRR